MVVCPACGMSVRSKQEECPHCGWRFERSGKFDCPFCGELIPVRSQKCPQCGIDLSKMSAKARAQSIDKIRGVLLADLTALESSEDGNYNCPKCAARLDGTEPKCAKCGQILIGKAGLRCPICTTPVGKRRKTCPVCGTALASIAKDALPMIPYVPVKAVGPTAEPEGPSGSRACPICGAIVPAGLRKCPLCNADFLDETPKPEIEVTPRVQEAPGEGIIPTPRPEITPPVKPPVVPVEEAVPPPQPETVSEVKEKPETQVGETAGPPRAEGPPKSRTLKSERVTTIDRGPRPSPRGLSNGAGRINGRGRVNGTGAVNGRAFVNGTGISNGLGQRSRRSTAERTRRIARWQLLAVILAIAIVVPAIILLPYSNWTDRYSIDGDFAEWEDATTYGTKIPSTAPSCNITEWAIAAQSSDLFLYFRTQGRMMSTSAAESYYLFVDSDGSNATGYVMESIGADYLLRLTGWDYDVNSSSLFRYSSSSDQLDWNAWTALGSLSYSTDGTRMEARASMPATLGNSARFVLLSKDSMERGSVSYAAPLKGPILIVEQVPSDEVMIDGLVPGLIPVEVLKVRFTSEGGSGHVDQVNPRTTGAPVVAQVASFSLENGASRDVTISVDASSAADGQLITAEVLASSIVSSYSSVVVTGSGASAYVGSPPAGITIDGAFADWTGRLVADQDPLPVTNPCVNIDEIGNVSTTLRSSFYVSVEGEMCSGTYVPAMIARPSGAGGGGAVVTARQTAEDILRIYIDSDRSNITGEWVDLASKEIGADRLVEVKGVFGMITSVKEFGSSPSGGWVETAAEVEAAKDAKRIEIGVSAASLGGSADIDFIVETTSWKGRTDLAVFDPSSLTASTRSWIVDSITTSPYATSMSYQRKMFYDGVNFWSFFFDGKDTVCKYSVDDGQTWTLSGRVFNTPGVNETSIWYDSSTSMVYAVGDTSLPSKNVSIQMGIVDAAAHTISWAGTDTRLATSLNPLAGKNTYISKDADGYLWVLAGNLTQLKPLQHDLSAFKSRAVNSTSSWMDTGGVLPYGEYESNSKGSIVPAGSGSDMWAVYTYEGYVAAKKYDGTWPEAWDEIVIYRGGTSMANTDNSPPSVVVDGKGVVHVVYGTGRADKLKRSIPQIEYSHSNPDLTFTVGLNLDPSNDTRLIGNYYPTISLETSGDSLYVIWLQCDSTFVPRTVMGRMCISGTWSAMTIEPQTNFVKQYMTSIYSVTGFYNICWQWTQNTTAPIEVLFDHIPIPEFADIALPLVGLIVTFVFYRRRLRAKTSRADL